jgi:hypothetical protein
VTGKDETLREILEWLQGRRKEALELYEEHPSGEWAAHHHGMQFAYLECIRRIVEEIDWAPAICPVCGVNRYRLHGGDCTPEKSDEAVAKIIAEEKSKAIKGEI